MNLIYYQYLGIQYKTILGKTQYFVIINLYNTSISIWSDHIYLKKQEFFLLSSLTHNKIDILLISVTQNNAQNIYPYNKSLYFFKS